MTTAQTWKGLILTHLDSGSIRPIRLLREQMGDCFCSRAKPEVKSPQNCCNSYYRLTCSVHSTMGLVEKPSTLDPNHGVCIPHTVCGTSSDRDLSDKNPGLRRMPILADVKRLLLPQLLRRFGELLRPVGHPLLGALEARSGPKLIPLLLVVDRDPRDLG